ncbi:MAG: sensor histidine kinase [Gammaproteobacteria bacterium]
MRLPRPRSLTSLMILGLLLVVVPLAFALTQAVTELRRLAAETENLVWVSSELAGHTQALYRHLSAYDRATQLYLLLGNPQLLEASRTVQRQITHTGARLAALPLGEPRELDLKSLRDATVGVLGVLEFADPDQPGRSELLTARLAAVDEATADLTGRANRLLDARLKQLSVKTTDTRRQLYLWIAALVPVAIALAVMFTRGVLQPLRRVDRAITELGRGTFSQPIAIRGSSDMEALGRQLEWLRVRLLELAQEKNRFLRYMSHELKTPLANVREGTDLLLDGAVGEIGPGQREVAAIMRQNALRLQQLIENLLSHSARQAQAQNLDVSSFDLGAVVAAAFVNQRLTLSSRRIRIAREVEPVVLNADRSKLRLVFDNLLSNALKFTPEGGSITARARRAPEGLVIDFADSGPGIPREERDRIFEAFYTGRTPQAGPLKGTGIGLSIVSELVAAHGGKVQIVDGEFPGAHFRITLPAVLIAEEPKEVRASA